MKLKYMAAVSAVATFSVNTATDTAATTKLVNVAGSTGPLVYTLSALDIDGAGSTDDPIVITFDVATADFKSRPPRFPNLLLPA